MLNTVGPENSTLFSNALKVICHARSLRLIQLNSTNSNLCMSDSRFSNQTSVSGTFLTKASVTRKNIRA